MIQDHRLAICSSKHRKMADFDPSGSKNPWTDFDESWHDWLRPGPHPTWQLWKLAQRGWSGQICDLSNRWVSFLFLLSLLRPRSRFYEWFINTVAYCQSKMGRRHVGFSIDVNHHTSTKLGGIKKGSIPKWRVWSHCRPEAKLQYGGHLFSKIGSTNYSAVDWDISNECHLSLNMQPE